MENVLNLFKEDMNIYIYPEECILHRHIMKDSVDTIKTQIMC